jgi:hypothetical protein
LIDCFFVRFLFTTLSSIGRGILLNKQVLKIVENVKPGDLIAVDWCDASVGKTSGSGLSIDAPVKSRDIYVGLIGDKIKHIVIAQNSFWYVDDRFDLDYTVIPIGGLRRTSPRQRIYSKRFSY